MVNEESALKLISSGLQNIAISLDGAKESTHDSIREKGAFKKALNAIAYLVKAKKKLGWTPKVAFPELVNMMVEADLKRYETQKRNSQ